MQHCGYPRCGVADAIDLCRQRVSAETLDSTGSIVVVGLIYFVYMTLNGVVQVPAFPSSPSCSPGPPATPVSRSGSTSAPSPRAGIAPYVAAQVVESTGNAMSPAYWVVGVCLIGTATLLAIRGTSRTTLPS
ncbi:hypothetical protein KTR9_2474 [Gordonia sp. KTR9]|nr:hypothetical protein KTR9_2474 [Gordonia sp. KTR9]